MSTSEEAPLDDIVKLNIGGEKVVQVQRSTLRQCEGSLLDGMFRGAWDQSLKRDEDGAVFIDQSPDLFIPLLNYLRARRDEAPSGPRACPPVNLGSAFEVMVEYYQLTHFVYRMQLESLSHPFYSKDVKLHNSENEWKIDSRTSGTASVQLKQTGHNRKVVGFSVRLDSLQNDVRVGWVLEGTRFDRFDQVHMNLGEVSTSVALDCNSLHNRNEPGHLVAHASTNPEPHFIHQEHITLICGVEKVNEGMTIECLLDSRRDGSCHVQPGWSVDGNICRPFGDRDWISWEEQGNVLPCIQIGSGSVTITNVKYE